MAQSSILSSALPTSLSTSLLTSYPSIQASSEYRDHNQALLRAWRQDRQSVLNAKKEQHRLKADIATPGDGYTLPAPDGGATGKGILIGMLSAFGSALFVALLFALIYFLRNTTRGRILLDRVGRPGQYDDEQQMLREEAEALETMSDLERTEYMRAKAFVQANPPESAPTDISLSQFLAIQEKGVSAWEFEPELEIANCFVEARTEIEFFDSECSVQSNLPIPKQNEVYYFECKIYEKPETSTISIGLTTKPYPLFRLPGLHRTSLSYSSSGHRRFNQPFSSTPYGPEFVHGDVIGVGYRPRTGTIFFTRNGKKLDDVAHGLKTQNFFPTVGANGPCVVHVNFGQSGFVFIEANVKKWGLAPATGSLAPPPPYGSEAGSILLETGDGSVPASSAYTAGPRHGRTRSRYGQPLQADLQAQRSPGPVRSPTDISLAQLVHVPSNEEFQDSENDTETDEPSTSAAAPSNQATVSTLPAEHLTAIHHEMPSEAPPNYTSPQPSPGIRPEENGGDDESDEEAPMLRNIAPIPSYDDAVEQGAGLGIHSRGESSRQTDG